MGYIRKNETKIKKPETPSLAEKLLSYLQLIRANNILILVLTIISAFIISDISFDPLYKTIVLVSASFIFAGGNALNDYFDLTIDIINRPNRPLPSGRISPTKAKNFGTTLIILGVISAYFLRRFHLFFATIAAILLFLYDTHLKKRFLIGNLVIAVLSGLVFVYAGGPKLNIAVIFAAIFSFLLHFAREIVKDIEDLAGDITMNASTLPIKLGIKKASIIVVIFLLVFLMLLFLPYMLGIFGSSYFYISLFGITPAIIFIILELTIGKTERVNYRLISFLLKAVMVLGVIALIAGKGFK